MNNTELYDLYVVYYQFGTNLNYLGRLAVCESTRIKAIQRAREYLENIVVGKNFSIYDCACEGYLLELN